MTRDFPLAPMSGLFLSLTVFLWALPVAFFAGHYPNNHNHPALALAPDGATLVVLGRGVARGFPLAELERAWTAYLTALGRRGYGPR